MGDCYLVLLRFSVSMVGSCFCLRDGRQKGDGEWEYWGNFGYLLLCFNIVYIY